jgi:hypothetical protein
MAPLNKTSDRFTEVRSDGEIVLMRVDTGEFLAFDQTAAAAWLLIDGSRDRDALVEALAAQFSGNRNQIAAELDQFLDELGRAGLLTDE